MAFLKIRERNQEILAIHTGDEMLARTMALGIVHQPVPDDPQQLVASKPPERRIDHAKVLDADGDERQRASACQFPFDPGTG